MLIDATSYESNGNDKNGSKSSGKTLSHEELETQLLAYANTLKR